MITFMAVKPTLRKGCIFIALTSLFGCVSTSPAVKTSFYTVNGQTGAQIDRELRVKGPLSGHALASAAISFEPVSVLQETTKAGCSFKTAKFRVKADITLPRWADRRASKDRDLRRAWDGLSKYAKLHEQMHVKIAEQFAKQIGESLMALPTHKTCEKLDKVAEKTFKRILRSHDRAQKRFDAIEQKRLAAIFEDA
ncbi:DUF922 domain-containing protein [Ahrensia sp. 13_GOM-1096m]|uniref:DUF922 domain-containing protein n=1 Tax=Ahrensia sp. 13_GOM-1096m TaxID=1380380 RepID=UPI000558B143|nr:DUF922 domain-containing protein [Ahrensia sp. 13_GOM-1096m]